MEGARCVLVGRDEGRLEAVRGALAGGVRDGDGDGDGRGHSVRVGDVGSAEFWGVVRREEVCFGFFLFRVSSPCLRTCSCLGALLGCVVRRGS